MRWLTIWIVLALTALLGGAGCAPDATSYIRDDVDFSFIRRVAIYPFDNLSTDIQAGPRVYSIFQAEVLQQEGLRTIDRGETLHGMQALHYDFGSELSPEQIVALGEELAVDAIFFGDVQEYGLERLGNDRTYQVTLSFSLVETQTGMLIWKSTVHQDGTSPLRKIFGGGSASLHEVTRQAVSQALETLF